MSTNEYKGHLSDSFSPKYFTGQDGFVFSKAALYDGLEAIELIMVGMEVDLDPEDCANMFQNDQRQFFRKTQVIANILKRCLDGVHLHTNAG